MSWGRVRIAKDQSTPQCTSLIFLTNLVQALSILLFLQLNPVLRAYIVSTHLSRNKELTLSTYDGLKKFCAEYGVKVDDNMCLACRLLFEYYGWLEKLDAEYELPSYDLVDSKIVKQNGKAMAYTLTEQFPFYSEYEKAVGPNNIDKVRVKGMASVEDWDSMGQSA